ncbi:hypothetical protein FRC12_009257 [Ceratobasidium sp. 428]|nr:hypothetical protein FRC12_009257 [Ceratobasidium sp. 428]
MYSLSKLALLVLTGLGLASTAVAAPIEAEDPLADAARHGWATHYNPGVGTGACGWNNNGNELVAAIGTHLYETMMIDGNPNHSKACGKHVHVTWHGKSTTAKVVDRCSACGDNDLDLSPAAFTKLAPLGNGKLNGIAWQFV